MSDKTLAVRGTSAVTAFNPQSLAEAMEFAKLLAASDLVPKDYIGKPGNVIVAMQMGAELGIAPTQAVQGIAVINGRPAVWGDLLLAVIQKSSNYEWHKESFDASAMTATCVMKRKGNPEPFVASFSQKDAETAGLWKKQGPWQTNPKRMLQLRARAFCGRNAFADALKGLASAEEAQDYIDITPESAPRSAPALPRELPAAAPEPAPKQAERPAPSRSVQETTPAPGPVEKEREIQNTLGMFGPVDVDMAPEAEPEVQGPELPEGVVVLTSAKPGVSGKRADGSTYQGYDVSWAGGKETTFSKTLYEKAKGLVGRPARLTIEFRSNGRKHITGVEPL
jgi:hypothetical protein